MKRSAGLFVLLLVLLGGPLSIAEGEADAGHEGGQAIGAQRDDPGEGGTDCSYLDEVAYSSWRSLHEWRGGYLCEGAYRCKRGSAWLGTISVASWAIPLPQAKAAATAGFKAAVTAGAVCAWVDTLACGPEDRRVEVGKKRKYYVYVGEEYRPGTCRKVLDHTGWEKVYFR